MPTDPLVRSTILDALRAARADGPYPCPEATLKDRVVAALRGKLPARGLRGRIGTLAKAVAVRDRPRTAEPWAVVLPGDEAQLYGMEADALADAVRALRAERAYPVTVPGLGKRLRLTPGGRAHLTARLLAGDVPEGLAVIRGRSPKVALAGEEDFDRALRKGEQLDLRIRLADLEARSTAPEAPRSFEETFDAAYDRLAAETRSRFVEIPRLRAALPDHDPTSFDAAVVALCEEDRYQLSEHEHASRLPEDEREAALVWGGRSYHFVSRVD